MFYQPYFLGLLDILFCFTEWLDTAWRMQRKVTYRPRKIKGYDKSGILIGLLETEWSPTEHCAGSVSECALPFVGLPYQELLQADPEVSIALSGAGSRSTPRSTITASPVAQFATDVLEGRDLELKVPRSLSSVLDENGSESDPEMEREGPEQPSAVVSARCTHCSKESSHLPFRTRNKWCFGEFVQTGGGYFWSSP